MIATFERCKPMAGSPTRTKRRVEGFERLSIELSFGVVNAAPKRFVEPWPPEPKKMTNPRDALYSLWLSAVAQTMMATIALEQLGDHLREKAGNGEVGPYVALDQEMCVTVAKQPSASV